MDWITFLGPFGSTFSHDAYIAMSEIFKTPKAELVAGYTNYLQATSNSEVLDKAEHHGCYGAIAMETLAEARVAESLEGFIRLLKKYDKLSIPSYQDGCPFHIIGALRMELNFCLMVRKDIDLEALNIVYAHNKSVGACKNRLKTNQFQIIEVPSNGEGARRLAHDPSCRSNATLGPKSASLTYNLNVLQEHYEDQRAVTTFLLIAPRMRKVSIGEKNRALIVFRLAHRSGSLVSALEPFRKYGLNLIQIHSVHTGNSAYDFAIEVDVAHAELPAFHNAYTEFEKCVERHLCFGPFEVLSL